MGNKSKTSIKITSAIVSLPKLFAENAKWIQRYIGYAEDIEKNSGKWGKPKANVKRPIFRYSTVGGRNQRKYDLRFHGQSIGAIYVNRNGVVFLTGKNKTNKEYFGSHVPELPENNGVEWHDPQATDFRKSFQDLDSSDVSVKSPEHQLENRLLAEFSKGSSRDKALLNIQPVRLYDCFFQMPTPISASGKEIVYVEERGGGIDILARCTHQDGSVHLCIMEVKDENKPSEPQAKAMEQALSYAVFIASLLHNPETGAAWWKLFGFNRALPTTLDIDVVTIMPQGDTPEFLDPISLPELNTILHPSTLYYNSEEYIKGKFVFSGTFQALLKK